MGLDTPVVLAEVHYGNWEGIMESGFKSTGLTCRNLARLRFNSCGSCGYPLHLTSSNRITSGIGSEYRQSIKKGFISFLSVDLSRFTQVDEVNCIPISWGRYRSKTKLICRKCGVLIGYGYGDSSALCGFESPTSSSSSYKNITIKIRALQPSDEC
ncbi:hypothetical protein RJ639_028231 [Escallonia herrerae]|uniref:Uncharacterized protein n=1 Tax=Escallonia herrerae TaxID=1293975 RepID=A0AA89BGA6_9ASTE|nr:hypothetical protein RJ639_028231 [Escallonia herrerae]